MEQSGRKTSCGSVEVEMMVHFCRSISGKEAIVAKRKKITGLLPSCPGASHLTCPRLRLLTYKMNVKISTLEEEINKRK